MHWCAYHKQDEPDEAFRVRKNGKLDSWCLQGRKENSAVYDAKRDVPRKAKVAEKKAEKAKATTKICTECKLEKPLEDFLFRSDREGKRHAKCADCYAEYQRVKNRESYGRHKDRRVQGAHKRYWEDPEKARAIVRRSIAKPEVHARKMAYMVTYNSPHRAFVKDVCERCGYQTKDPKFKKDLDVHHKDNNHSNNDPNNLETLCPPCHRLL